MYFHFAIRLASYPMAVSLGVKRPGREATTHLLLVPRLIMSGIIPPIPLYVFIAWCLVKQGNFTFTSTFTFTFPIRFQVVYIGRFSSEASISFHPCTKAELLMQQVLPSSSPLMHYLIQHIYMWVDQVEDEMCGHVARMGEIRNA